MSDTVRLRYTGKQAKTFPDHGIGEVEEGAEFEVPADQAERFTRRDDVEFTTRGMKVKAAKAEADTEEPADPRG